jgi:hypothetical protein
MVSERSPHKRPHIVWFPVYKVSRVDKFIDTGWLKQEIGVLTVSELKGVSRI